MSAITEVERNALRAWAARKPRIRRVSLFGSRVKGTHRADSDLDIAIELEPGEDSNATLTVWMHESDAWKEELAALFLFPIDLQWHDPFGTTEIINRGTSEACETVYERAS